MVSIIWGAVTVALIITAVKRDSNGRAFVPWSFPAMAGVVTASSLFGSSALLIIALLIGATVVAIAKFKLAMVAVGVAAVLVFGSVAVAAVDTPENDSTASAAGSPVSSTDSTSDAELTETSTPAPEGLDENKLAESFAKEFKKLGFKPGEVKVGKVNWAKNPTDNRGGAFGGRVESQQELTQFLNGNSAESLAARQHVLEAAPKGERNRVLNGMNYIPVQFGVATSYSGNTYVKAGEVVRGGSKTAQAGDIVWVYVTQDYDIAWDSSVRADCSNPGYTKPPRPGTPPNGNPPPEENPPPCEKDCGPPPCEVNCGPPPCEKDCGPPPCEVNCGPPPCPPGQVGTPPDCLEPKDPEDDPTPPDGVTPLPQSDPVENTPPPPPADPIDTDEEPGDSTSDVPAPDSTPVPDDGPPPVTDPDNTPDEENPGTEISDPDASLLVPLFPLLLGAARLRRRK